jgi:acyl-CoA hydrolase
VRVVVEAERRLRGGASVTVTQAEVIYVNLGEDNRPKPISSAQPDPSDEYGT